ncbi:UDPGT domain-containing protein [Cephalotus follicularis]|uniref:Glycosyltransferase n=1 Tax=Cephalotus follicularis TaxID=3775 RepID=A0A1Q3CUD9_CEPFO|nr:UDPGT domain-containing protein [Cephalotus follicularis]
MATPSTPTPHVVIFPFMAQGHILPLLDISKAMASNGVRVTIITTPSNSPFILSKTSHYSQISLSIIPFPKVEDIPEGCENVTDLPSLQFFNPFVKATRNLKQPFEDILAKMSKAGCLPICVISDMFLGWTVETCRSFGIPRIVSHGMGVLPMLIAKDGVLHAPYIRSLLDSDNVELLSIPKLPFPLIKADLPDAIRSYDPDLISLEIQEADKNSWGVIVNSFEELEGEFVVALESFFQKGAKAWCVGPTFLYDQVDQHYEKQSCPYIKWLDKQVGLDVVIYVSFGTQSHISNTQMDEIALGLEMAGQPFILVERSKTWVPPEGWMERIDEKGLVVRDWVDQRSILSHRATGGFLSHCGWNSVLEGLSMGVPLLAWPMGAEQKLNAKYVAMGLGAGLMVPQGSLIDRHVICDGVKGLMEGERGREARERAKFWSEIAIKAVEKGGSSRRNLDELVQCLVHRERRVI